MQKNYPDDRLLSRSEIHAHFGIPQRTLEVAARRKIGPPIVRLGRSVRYRTSDVRKWIDARRGVPPSQSPTVSHAREAECATGHDFQSIGELTNKLILKLDKLSKLMAHTAGEDFSHE